MHGLVPDDALVAQLDEPLAPGAVPILAVHDEVVVECDEGDAEKVKAWLRKAMVDGMDDVVNATEPQVPIEVETSVSEAWG